ncbi:UNVERIFIED_CONTAM: hypothetical protein K2H54_005401 [Gekko kuhli]
MYVHLKYGVQPPQYLYHCSYASKGISSLCGALTLKSFWALSTENWLHSSPVEMIPTQPQRPLIWVDVCRRFFNRMASYFLKPLLILPPSYLQQCLNLALNRQYWRILLTHGKDAFTILAVYHQFTWMPFLVNT